jgi:hypothetical protein
MKMNTTNYSSTFIEVAADCPVAVGTAPPEKEPRSAAQIEYEESRRLGCLGLSWRIVL